MPTETNVGGARIKTTNGETKLFRDSHYPVLRGTALILDESDESNANLWTTSYVPQLDTYIGPKTPNPLFITVLRSKQRMPEIETVLYNIMGLTKINYNSCNFNDGLPITVRFANMVGEVLTMDSDKGAERQLFKYVLAMPETLQVSCDEAGHIGPDPKQRYFAFGFVAIFDDGVRAKGPNPRRSNAPVDGH